MSLPRSPAQPHPNAVERFTPLPCHAQPVTIRRRGGVSDDQAAAAGPAAALLLIAG